MGRGGSGRRNLLVRAAASAHCRKLLVRFFTLTLLPLTVVGYVYLMAAVSAYLVDRDWEFRLRQTIVIVLGLSVGCFVFAAAMAREGAF